MFTKEYYRENKQDKDRIAFRFYTNVVKNNFKINNFLDYGCGTGYFLKRISKLKKIEKLYGFDVSSYAKSMTKKHAIRSIIIKDLKQIANHSIDLISALHVIEHIPDAKLIKIFKSFKRIINQNGVIMFVTPAKDGLAHQIKKKKWIGLKDKTHINLKTYEQWITFFAENNLALIKASNDGLWDFPYLTKKFVFKFFQIFLIMIIQIFFGKLILQPNEGETFIFILKFKQS